MILKKHGYEYTITELADKWKVERETDGVIVRYKVPKELAPDAATLERYIEEHGEIF